MENLVYELLVIDQAGKTNIKQPASLGHGLLFAEQLWQEPLSNALGIGHQIKDAKLDIEVLMQPIDTSAAINDIIESAFLIQVKSRQQESLEPFRVKFLQHLKYKLGFSNIRILRDDVSTNISREIYPLINKVENELRRYLVKFFIQKVGLNWFEKTVKRKLSDKITYRKDSDKIFTPLADTDVMLIDFDDLGEVIYRPANYFYRGDQLYQKLMAAQTTEDVQRIKEEFEGNYSSYLKKTFQDRDFERKWRALVELRNKTAHNGLFVASDLQQAELLTRDVSQIIFDAEENINEFRFSIVEQEAIMEEAFATTQEERTTRTPFHFDLKILDKIQLPESKKKWQHAGVEQDDDFDEEGQSILTELELLQQLDRATRWYTERGKNYVGLKGFVTSWLAKHQYDPRQSYSLINILRDKGVVDIVDIEDENYAYPVRAIRKSANLF